MKKILATIVMIVIAGCTGTNQNTVDSKSTDSTSSFERKKECALLADGAKQQMNETYQLAQPFFYSIFYSPKVDSCVYTYGLVLSGVSPNETGSFVLADFFTGESLVSETYYNDSDDEQLYSYVIREKWNGLVDEYR